MSRGLGTKRDVAASLAILGDILLAQGDLNGAEKTYVESAQIYEQMGEKGNLATSQISLATLALAKQSAPKAEELARQGVTECEAEGDAAGAATGRDILVQSLIEQNKVAEATEVMKEARKIQVQDVIVRLSLAVTEARLEGRTGNVDEALHSLDNTIKSARAMKLIGYELEARLAKAEVQLDAGATPTPPSDLKELVEEANAKGYHLIGLKAARL
jgi:predicted negative regulator of RcsB-dependent stress response